MTKQDLKKKNSGEIQEELIHEMEDLTSEIHKQNSRPRIFWDGIIRGLGYAVGATVLFGLAVAILSFLANNTDIPWIEDFIRWIGLLE